MTTALDLRHPNLDHARAWLEANRELRPRGAPISTADRLLKVRAEVVAERRMIADHYRAAHTSIANRAGGGLRGKEIADRAMGGFCTHDSGYVAQTSGR